MQVREAVREGSGPFALPQRLARVASFAWDMSPSSQDTERTYFTDKGRVSTSLIYTALVWASCILTL